MSKEDPLRAILELFSKEAQEAATYIPNYEGSQLVVTVMALRTLIYRDEFVLRVYETALESLKERVNEPEVDFPTVVRDTLETVALLVSQIDAGVKEKLIGYPVQPSGTEED